MQQQQPGMMASPQAGATPGSYAARSSQAYSQPAGSGLMYTNNSSNAGSYLSRSQQAYAGGTTPQHQAGSYAQRSTQAYYGSGSMISPPPSTIYQSNDNFANDGASVVSAVTTASTMMPQQQPGLMQQSGMMPSHMMPNHQMILQQQQEQQQQQELQQQQRLLTEATRKVQEHAYYMNQAMTAAPNDPTSVNIPVALDRAAHLVGELGVLMHGGAGSNTPNNSMPQAATGLPSNTGYAAHLTPKHYYELYMRVMEELPAFQDFCVKLCSSPSPSVPTAPDQVTIVDGPTTDDNNEIPGFTLRQLFDYVQYFPRVLPRLYLQIMVGSLMIPVHQRKTTTATIPNTLPPSSTGAKWILHQLLQVVKCEQNPVRGLFLRHYLLTALRDKLPDTPPVDRAVTEGGVTTATSEKAATSSVNSEEKEEEEETHPIDLVLVEEHEEGTVEDSYKFVLENFMEMNKLWVRIQHLPGDGNSKDVRKRRERERNDLRLLVGTNLVRLSQLENITSKIYGEVILNQILDHIVTCGDPLSQAYLMDCLVQAFPDEYHIETLPILLGVCPRLRDKVNVRTILQGLMDRLANYLADEELLDEDDTNQVKKELARDSFGMFEDCVQKVYNARGPKLTSREVIRLQTALLNYSVKVYPDDNQQIARCLGVCVTALRQANASYEMQEGTVAAVPTEKIHVSALDDVSATELEKLLSVPLDRLALQCLKLDHYSDLIQFLPWSNRREVSKTMLEAVDKAGAPPQSVEELEQLLQVIEPLVRDEIASVTTQMTNLSMNKQQQQYMNQMPPQQQPASLDLKVVQSENTLVCKLVHLVNHTNTDTFYVYLEVFRKHLDRPNISHRTRQTLVALVFAAIRLARQIFRSDNGLPDPNKLSKNETREGVDASEDGDKKDSQKVDEKGPRTVT